MAVVYPVILIILGTVIGGAREPVSNEWASGITYLKLEPAGEPLDSFGVIETDPLVRNALGLAGCQVLLDQSLHCWARKEKDGSLGQPERAGH